MNELFLALAGFVGLLVVIIIVRYMFYPRKERASYKKSITADFISRKFDEVLALRAILAIKKESGILLHAYIVEGDDTFSVKSPDFITGVVHAMRNIGQEIGFSQHFSRLVYGDYHILSNEGQHVQAVLVSRIEPTSIMEDNLLLFVKAMEKRFAGVFKDEKPYINMSEFEPAAALIRDVFDTYFIDGLNLLYDPEKTTDEIRPLARFLLDEAAKQFQRANVVVLKQLFIDVYPGIQDKYTKGEVLLALHELHANRYLEHFGP